MSENKAVIKISGISKSYDISHQKKGQDTLKDRFEYILKYSLGKKNRVDHETFWALKDVSFEVNKGEIFGVIGKNGSGKSTLLKILSRIIDPTEGKVELHGRVASLLEVGTGFHPELTGRENIFFNGSMIGMSRQEIKARFDEIVAFSEIEKFIDTPVKFYSSGMYVRLAFSVAAHLEPDILILDEVLAVGDAGFQKKSLNKILATMESGCTVLIVTHGAENLRRLCKRGVMLENGQVKSFGKIDKVLMDYSGSLPVPEDPRSTVLSEVSVNYSHIKDADNLTSESEMEAEVEFTVTKDLPNCYVNFYVEDSAGRYIFHTRTDYGGLGNNFAKGIHKVSVKIPRLSLNAGAYTTWFRFVSEKEYGEYAKDTRREVFEVEGREDDAKCPIDILSEWKIQEDGKEK